MKERTDTVERLLRLVGPRDPVPAERAARVKENVREEWRLAHRRRQRRRVAAWAAALATAASVALVLVWPRPAVTVAVVERIDGRVGPGPSSLVPGGSVAAGTWIETEPRSRIALRLVSGASLRLDLGTRARVVSTSELVLDRGAVYLDSGGGAGLSVRTPFGTARDVGTQFEVRVLEHAVRLRVREGAVDLFGSGRNHTARPGDELRLTGAGALTQGVVELFGAEWEWAEAIAPPFGLEGRSLRAFLEWYTHETHQRVDLPPDKSARSAEEIVLHGSIRDMRPDEALEAVLSTSGLSYRRTGTGVVVAPARSADRSGR